MNKSTGQQVQCEFFFHFHISARNVAYSRTQAIACNLYSITGQFSIEGAVRRAQAWLRFECNYGMVLVNKETKTKKMVHVSI